MTAAEKQYGAALYQLAQEEGCTEEARAGLELTAGLLAHTISTNIKITETNKHLSLISLNIN